MPKPSPNQNGPYLKTLPTALDPLWKEGRRKETYINKNPQEFPSFPPSGTKAEQLRLRLARGLFVWHMGLTV